MCNILHTVFCCDTWYIPLHKNRIKIPTIGRRDGSIVLDMQAKVGRGWDGRRKKLAGFRNGNITYQ